MGKYDDIIRLPHHKSAKHPKMPTLDRAAQFLPFAALLIRRNDPVYVYRDQFPAPVTETEP